MQNYLRAKSKRIDLFLKFNGQCQHCGKTPYKWHADHILPKSRGGSGEFENFQLLCAECNLKKGIKMTAYEYEQLTHFTNDFPNNNGQVRICQVGAYNAVIQNLVVEKSKTCSAIVPTGGGKTDLVRAISIGLKKHKIACGAMVFSPSKHLRKQLVDNNHSQFITRFGIDPSDALFMEDEDIINMFRNDAVLMSYTTQLLTAPKNCDRFLKEAKRVESKFGLTPVAVFDESHLYRDDLERMDDVKAANFWGECVGRFEKMGIPVILITGTPYRSDNGKIPGFKIRLTDQVTIKPFVKTEKTDDPLVIKVRSGTQEATKYYLEADYHYTYKRAWIDGIIIRPNEQWVDATTFFEKSGLAQNISDLKPSSANPLLRKFLSDSDTIASFVNHTITCLRARKASSPDCAAIVTTLSDLDDSFNMNDMTTQMSDIHATRIQREFEHQAPDLKALVVTSNTPPDLLQEFQANSYYDILIVKSMGVVGFDCPRIKVVVLMNNHRTMPGLVQSSNRGCRVFDGKHKHYDLIMSKDHGMQELFEQFKTESDLSEAIKILEENEKEVTAESKEDQKDIPSFSNHNITSTFDNRNNDDLIDDLFREHFATLYNEIDRESRLQHFAILHKIGFKFPGKEEIAPTKVKTNFEEIIPIIGMPVESLNAKEKRLRKEANDLQKEIALEIFQITGRAYSQTDYSDITKLIWTCVKRAGGFPPNQSMQNLIGIDNYAKIVECFRVLKSSLPNGSWTELKSFLLTFKKV